MCFRLREKKNRLLEPITKELERAICLCGVKYPIFMHYVTITSSGMYSIDICAVSQLLMTK